MLQSEPVTDQLEIESSGLLLIPTEGSTVAGEVARLRSLSARMLERIPEIKKLIRYGSTSILALVISEVTLVLLYANNVVGATSAALLANFSGTIPSYLLSRYWIWSAADRRRPGRQAAVYWIISIVSMLISSFVTGQISHHTPKERVLHLTVLAGSYLVISMVLWVAKYVVYERTIFKHEPAELAATS